MEPPNKKAKHDPSRGPEVADARSHGSKKSSKKTTKKTSKYKKTVTSDSDSSKSEHLCGKLCSQPTKEEVKKCQCRHADKWASDLPSMQSYRQWKEIIPDNLPPNNFKDHSNYIRQVLCNNKSAGLSIARSHKSRAAVDYTLISVEPHRPTQGVWPIAAVANDSQLHLVASSI